MGEAKDCLYCVSEITNGFRYDGRVDMMAWEKSLSLAMCDAGASATQVGAIVLGLRFRLFLQQVSKALGMKRGEIVTNPLVIEYILKLFKAGWMPEETAKRTKLEFPRFPWKDGGPPPTSPSEEITTDDFGM